MRRFVKLLVLVALVGFGVFWFLTNPMAPKLSAQVTLADLNIDLQNGEKVFWAGGCASCHAAKDAKAEEKLNLGGGHRLETPFGTFVSPNISPDQKTGIGNWSVENFRNAMKYGQSPQGEHYYPSFPYGSYARMETKDIVDLFGYLKTLPKVSRANESHELALPFQWRRPLGIWKLLFLNDQDILKDANSDVVERGRYLVEGMAHCGECHTPRNLIGGMKTSKWLAGGPAPEGDGKIPNITAHDTGVGSWSEEDIVYYLESGFTPDYDSAGGSMVDVQENMARLPKSDLEAIAAYLKAVPAVASK